MRPHTSRAGRWTGRILLGLAALATLIALVAGVPVLLLVAWQYLGPPIPTWHELASPDDGTLFVRMLCLIGWISWTTFTWAVLAEIVAKILGWRLPTLRWQQRAAAGLVAAVTLAVSSPALASATAGPVRAAPVAAAPATQTPTGPAAVTTPSTIRSTVEYRQHVVRPGEQMPALAERFLGDKMRWRDIAVATYGVEQPDGRSLRPGDTRVYPGWIVRYPATTGAAAPAPAARAATPEYAVTAGDWLWHIADRFLGDPERYLDIEALNPDLERRDGAFPDHIEAGWRLVLPPDAHDRGPRPHATGTLVAPSPPTGPSQPGTPPPPLGGGPADPPAEPGTGPSGSASPSGAPAISPTGSPTSPAPGANSTAVPQPNVQAPAVEDDSVLDNLALIGVPLAGAGLLAALLLTRLYRGRRRQEQHRPVGRRLPEPETPVAETQLKVVAQPVAVDRLDHALRHLAATLADRRPDQMPDVIGAWLTVDAVNLLLTRPCPDPPAPWSGNQLSWTLPAFADLPDVDGQLAPLPTLAAVGSEPGVHLLLDLERLGLLTITGDPRRGTDLLRYVAAELACNAWSDHVDITIAGFDAAETGELLALGSDRIDAAPTIQAAVERIRRRASQVVQSLDHLGAADPVVGRITDVVADAWMPHVVLAHDPSPADVAALQTLDADLADSGRCAVAVVVTSGQEVGRWPIRIEADGTLNVSFLGMTDVDASVAAAGLPRAELAALAELLDSARRGTRLASVPATANHPNGNSWPHVPSAPEPEPWANGTDANGAPLPEPDQTAESVVPIEPKPSDAHDPHSAGPAESIDAAARIPAVVALTGQQSHARRPVAAVPRRHSDPTLDADLRAWDDADPDRPRIAILGPVTVDAPGQPPPSRPRFYAEIIVYLAVRGARGATTDQFDEAIWPGQAVKPVSRRVAVTRARRWCGETSDGQAWLPDATADRRYKLHDGFLLDWHLFRRLRTRGEHRGPAGISDLRQALSLVRGAPLAGADVAYSAAARNPYPWLPGSEIQPYHLTSAIVDTAHRLVELCLTGGDIVGARWAVDRAWLADPEQVSDIAWRDVMRVAAAEGNLAELDQLLGDLMRLRDAEVPEDLDSETYRLLCELMPERMRAGIR